MSTEIIRALAPLLIYPLIVTLGCTPMKREAPREIRVSYPASTELNGFDPARVQLAQQYFILENLYGTLIDRDARHPGA